MNRILPALVLVVICGSIASAQQPAGRAVGKGSHEPPLLTPETVTPEMWYYSQEQRRYDDPRQAVRRKAEFVSQQRAMRIASMKWFGMSNSRPYASTTPFMDEYSPSWIGNSYHPYHWVGVGSSSTAVYYTPAVIVR